MYGEVRGLSREPKVKMHEQTSTQRRKLPRSLGQCKEELCARADNGKTFVGLTKPSFDSI